jgi:hypothetical protein
MQPVGIRYQTHQVPLLAGRLHCSPTTLTLVAMARAVRDRLGIGQEFQTYRTPSAGAKNRK